MKKALKVTAITLGVIILLLALTPFIFRGTMERLLQDTINKNLTATVDWESMDLSLFSSFPDAAITINNFTVINKAPFEGDTLAYGSLLKLDMGITQLFKGSGDPIIVDALQLDETTVTIKIDSLGNNNYDIAIKDDAPLADDSKDNQSFVFDLKHYEINDGVINFLDEESNFYLYLTEVAHEGNGDLSADISTLDTETQALATLQLEGIEYLSENSVLLDAVFKLDLPNDTYTFMENEARINELPLNFEGSVTVNEDSNDLDLSFRTPSSDFRNFLAVIPKVYVKELDGVQTSGNFTVNGEIKGRLSEERIPTLNIKVRSENASFKYPDLPKSMSNIAINVDLINETGIASDTYLNIENLMFKIDERLFQASGNIRNLSENALVDLDVKGSLDLANIEQVLPLDLSQELSGIFTADVSTEFDMRSVQEEQYQNITTSGIATLEDFRYQDDSFNHPLEVSKAAINMNAQRIQLTELKATSGNSDIAATGTIQNLIPWLLTQQQLKGTFDVQSKRFDVNDLLTSEENTSASSNNSTAANSSVTLPEFLDATLNFTADEVIYDNLTLDEVSGTIKLNEKQASLMNVRSNILGGKVNLGGNISTQNSIPTFAMELDLNRIDIDDSFEKLSFLKFLAPIAKAIQGNLNTQINLSGNLNQDLAPDLKTIRGNAVAQILTAEIDPEQTPLLARLSERLSFLKLDKLSLRDLSTVLTFNKGTVEVQPFDFVIKGINVAVEGGHNLDKSMNYQITMDVPARYLGSDVSRLLSKLDPAEAEKISVGLPIGLTGTFNSPNIQLNTEAAVKSLTQKLLDKQKDDLINRGTGILGDIIGGNKPTDTTQTTEPTNSETSTSDVVKDVLGGIFNRKRSQKDSVPDNN